MATSNPWQYWSAQQLATAVGIPVANVTKHWPIIVTQLDLVGGMQERAVWEGVAAHVRVETGGDAQFGFTPVKESYWLTEAQRESLYATRYGRGGAKNQVLYGRGYLQCSIGNYNKYPDRMDTVWGAGGALAAILRNDLDNWLQPDNSALFLACYLRDHGGDNAFRIPKAMRAGDHRESRRLVQGADAGLDDYIKYVSRLAAIGQPVPEPTPRRYVFPVQGYTGTVPLHWGTHPGGSDLFAMRGTPVLAIADGVVVYRTEWSGIGGNSLQIQHTNGDGLESYYAHGDEAPRPRMGQAVKAGEQITTVGDSGNAASAGPHLHFGMGVDISDGSGPGGGCGTEFDAVTFLRQLLTGAPQTPLPEPGIPEPWASRIKELEAALTDKDVRLREAVSQHGYLTGDIANELQNIVNTMKGLRLRS